MITIQLARNGTLQVRWPRTSDAYFTTLVTYIHRSPQHPQAGFWPAMPVPGF